MASFNEIVRQIREQVDLYSQSLTGCKSALDIETATRAFVTCITGLGVKDHIVEFLSTTMPQDYEEQKDPVGEFEASLLKLLR
jgi:transcriptional regulatory protein LevR